MADPAAPDAAGGTPDGAGPASPAGLYRTVRLIRRFEERAIELVRSGDIAGGIQSTMEFTFECEGASKPSCVAEIIFRSYV